MSADSSAWVLSRGSYSDYRVLAVCSSKAVATTLATRMNAVSDHERVRKVFGDRRAMLKSEPALRAKREQVGR